jgi:ParB family transcriptional regulator, chromosome partitioning protein
MAKSTPPQKSRLGRGLSSLIQVAIPEAEPAPVPATVSAAPAVEVRIESDGTPLLLALASIRPNPHQPRRTFPETALRELADSIKINGVIQPIVVRKTANPEVYELIAGERRLRASKLAGLTQVPAFVRDVDGLTQAQMALVENVQREDLNPIERAEGYRALLSQLGLTQAELAGRMGEDRSSITNFLRLLDLASPVKDLVRTGVISVGHGKLLASVPDMLEQERIARMVVEQGLSVRNLERLIEQRKLATPPPGVAGRITGKEAHYAELERTLSKELGLRVKLVAGRGKGKGKMTLHYGSLEEFDRLMERLGVSID